MGLIRTMLAAGALGAAQKGHIASRYFMESPENDARIKTMFPPTLNEHMYMTDADNAADAQRIEAMHRVHTNFAQGDGFLEAAPEKRAERYVARLPCWSVQHTCAQSHMQPCAMLH